VRGEELLRLVLEQIHVASSSSKNGRTAAAVRLVPGPGRDAGRCR
jgi:hypothetical protein